MIHFNSTDAVIFGETLVGNNAMDLLTKFNESLIDYGENWRRDIRTIDGMLQTKFDTVDVKGNLLLVNLIFSWRCVKHGSYNRKADCICRN